MSIKVFADGSPLLASEINTNLMNQSVIVTTSARTSMPAAVEGMTVYETDTDKLLTYISTTVGWQLPWNMPWGCVGVGVATADQTGLTFTDITNMSVTWTSVAHRRYRMTANFVAVSTAGAPALQQTVIRNGAGSFTYGYVAHDFSVGANAFGVCCVGYMADSTAASQTAKVAFGRQGGDAATYTIQNATSMNGVLIVEDIGPAAAPVA